MRELHGLVPYNRDTLRGFLDPLGSFAPQGGVDSCLGHLHLDEEVPVEAFEVDRAARKRRRDWEGAARYGLRF